ncbi:MAG: PHP domain-containing protein [Lachnospiraceae bacterium]|nr:PHP domain-containing protein [Lachnospiraceae bacterium]
MKKADLHIHSTVSDGSLSIAEIIDTASKIGLDVIAITDHDTLSHAEQITGLLAKKEYENLSLKVLAGLEISCFDNEENYRVHVLGYDIKKPEIVENFVHPLLLARHENSMKQIQILNESGFRINPEKIKKADGKYIYKQHIMDYLVSIGQAEALFGKFYHSTFKNGGICHFDIQYLDPYKAVEVIKEAGGKAVLAHSGQQQNFCLISKLVERGLDGLELNHHANTGEDKEIIKEYADRYHLFLTGGSDFHGRYEANSPSIGDYLAEESGVDAIVNGCFI